MFKKEKGGESTRQNDNEKNIDSKYDKFDGDINDDVKTPIYAPKP